MLRTLASALSQRERELCTLASAVSQRERVRWRLFPSPFGRGLGWGLTAREDKNSFPFVSPAMLRTLASALSQRERESGHNLLHKSKIKLLLMHARIAIDID